MGHSYISSIFHCTFSTKERRRTIHHDFRPRLWAYIGGVARKNDMTPLAVGGTDDHAHVLVSIPARLAVARAVQLIKAGSSKWVHDTFPRHQQFEWQEGYGAFSVSMSHVPATIIYIENQEAHHRTMSFEEEFLSFLRKHGISYDERYVLG